jgi:CRP-like cAMP-binding protein
LQVAAIGRCGVVGVPIILEADESPHHVVAHVPCDAYRLSTSAMRDLFRRSPTLRHAFLQAAHDQLVMIGNVALCHRFHTALQRLSRCLLTYAVGTSSDTIALTQHVMADMVGSPRTVVSRAVGHLQDLNAVRQRHGRLEILDRHKMSECACDCGSLDEPRAPTDPTSHR